MISARENGFRQLLLSLQLLIISIVFWLTVFLVLSGFHGQSVPVQTYSKYWAVILLAMVFENLTRPKGLQPGPGRIRRVAGAVSRRQWVWIAASMTAFLAFSQDRQISRLLLATFLSLLIFVLFAMNRNLVKVLTNWGAIALKQWRLRTFILGPDDWCASVIPEIERLNTMLTVSRIEKTDSGEQDLDTYLDMLSEQPIDILVMPARHMSNDTVMGLMRHGERMGFRCWLPLELTRAYGRRFDIQRVGRLDVLSPPSEPLENTYNQMVKRLFDIAFSLLVLTLVLPPLIALVWAIHRLQSPGPLFFRQERMGKNGRPFQVYKFRSLHVRKADDEATQVTKDDNRVFSGGRFLRKSSLDEIPQFLNVLIGDMSVVGPRPHLEKHDHQFREVFESYGVRRYVKPGVTGLAQVKGYRGEINHPRDLRHRVRMDNFYVRNWDVGMDVRIIMKTSLSVIKPPKSAY